METVICAASLSVGVIVGITIVCIVGVILLLGLAIALFFVFPKRWTFDYIDTEKKFENISREWYESLDIENIKIKSSHGYDLSCKLIVGEKTDRTIIFAHGYTYNIVGSLKYIRRFLSLGYNLFFYDHAACGDSGGKMSTFGVRESEDMGQVVKYLRERFGENHKIGLHGESMGAATAILYAEKDQNLSFIIEDCGFSNLFDELKFQFKKSHLPVYPLIWIVILFSSLFTGVKMVRANPIDVLKSGKCDDIPVLFVHGDKDPKTPVMMCTEMYEAKKGVKDIMIVPDAVHARAITKAPDKYMDKVKNFIEKTDFNY